MSELLNPGNDTTMVSEDARRITDMLGTRPVAAIVLGSGLSTIAARLGAAPLLQYRQLKSLPKPTVDGHAGELRYLDADGVCTLFFCGRSHFYEGHNPAKLAAAVRVAATAGCRTLISCCAVGSLKTELAPGSISLIRDHINFIGINPLRGLSGPAGSDYFLSTVNMYNPDLRAIACRLLSESGENAHEAVYGWVCGPSYETPAESHMMSRLGADVVGMSLVPETLTGHWHGMDVCGVGCITNYAPGIGEGIPSHKEVLEAASAMAEKMQVFLQNMQKYLHD